MAVDGVDKVVNHAEGLRIEIKSHKMGISSLSHPMIALNPGGLRPVDYHFISDYFGAVSYLLRTLTPGRCASDHALLYPLESFVSPFEVWPRPPQWPLPPTLDASPEPTPALPHPFRCCQLPDAPLSTPAAECPYALFMQSMGLALFIG